MYLQVGGALALCCLESQQRVALAITLYRPTDVLDRHDAGAEVVHGLRPRLRRLGRKVCQAAKVVGAEHESRLGGRSAQGLEHQPLVLHGHVPAARARLGATSRNMHRY